MGRGNLCLAEDGGSNGAIGSGAVPRKSCEPIRGTTSVDDVALFDINTRPEFVAEQGRETLEPFGEQSRSTRCVFFLIMTGLDFSMGQSDRCAAETSGSGGAVGSKGIPRQFYEWRRWVQKD